MPGAVMEQRREKLLRNNRDEDGWMRSEREWHPTKPEDKPVNIEKVTLSWSLLKILGGIVSGAGAIIYVTVTINTFFYQAETFRASVTAQIEQLNNNIRMLGEKLDGMSRSPDIVRVRDLAEFCYELELENKEIFRCPSGYRVQPKRKADAWKPQ